MATLDVGTIVEAVETIPSVLARALTLTRDAIMVIDSALESGQLRVAYVNEAFVRTTGFSHEEVVGSHPRHLLRRSADRLTIAHAVAELQDGRPFDGHMIYLRHDGAALLLHCHVEAIGGVRRQYLAVIRDVTGDRPGEAITHHLSRALDRVDEAIVVLSSERSVRYVNQVAHELFGGEDGLELSLPESIWRHIEQGATWHGSVELPTQLGARLLRIETERVDVLGSSSLVLIIHDITEMERLQHLADALELEPMEEDAVAGW